MVSNTARFFLKYLHREFGKEDFHSELAVEIDMFP